MPRSTMRILEVGKYYPPHRGGMETTLESLCRGLARRGHDVRCLVAAEGQDELREVRDGVALHRVGNWGELRSMPMLPGLWSALGREIRDFGPDLLHLHLPHPLAMLAIRWRRLRMPLVLTYHSDIVRQRWLRRIIARDRQVVLSRATAIHVSSEALLAESRDLRPHLAKCEAIPFGVDVDWYREIEPHRRQRWRDAIGEEFALFVGRLVYYKGLDVLFESLRETTIPLVVVGEGPLRAEWETLSRVMGLGDQVRFVGAVGPESLRALYQTARLFVLPSQARAETFGVVQLEAMAAGCPMVVCRASGGVASVHEEGRTARLVAAGDSAALREAVVEVWQDESLRRSLATAALDRVRAFFDVNRSVDRLESLLQRAVTPR